MHYGWTSISTDTGTGENVVAAQTLPKWWVEISVTSLSTKKMQIKLRIMQQKLPKKSREKYKLCKCNFSVGLRFFYFILSDMKICRVLKLDIWMEARFEFFVLVSSFLGFHIFTRPSIMALVKLSICPFLEWMMGLCVLYCLFSICHKFVFSP